MPIIAVECIHCGAKLKVKAGASRTPPAIKCPKCGKQIPLAKKPDAAPPPPAAPETAPPADRELAPPPLPPTDQEPIPPPPLPAEEDQAPEPAPETPPPEEPPQPPPLRRTATRGRNRAAPPHGTAPRGGSRAPAHAGTGTAIRTGTGAGSVAATKSGRPHRHHQPRRPPDCGLGQRTLSLLPVAVQGARRADRKENPLQTVWHCH